MRLLLFQKILVHKINPSKNPASTSYLSLELTPMFSMFSVSPALAPSSSEASRAILLLLAVELELAPVALRYILLGIWKWKSLDICLLELKSFLLLENYIQYNKLRLNSKQQYSSIKNNQGLLLLLISLGVVIVLCAMFRPLPQYDI